jgi:hypothetical protein
MVQVEVIVKLEFVLLQEHVMDQMLLIVRVRLIHVRIVIHLVRQKFRATQPLLADIPRMEFVRQGDSVTIIWCVMTDQLFKRQCRVVMIMTGVIQMYRGEIIPETDMYVGIIVI